jgi:ABC-type uncharacterized transport system ATPase subunit
VREHPGRYELTVARGADVQSILTHALARFRVRRFEVRAPRLHDIFLKLAGDDAGAVEAVNAVTAAVTAKGE